MVLYRFIIYFSVHLVVAFSEIKYSFQIFNRVSFTFSNGNDCARYLCLFVVLWQRKGRANYMHCRLICCLFFFCHTFSVSIWNGCERVCDFHLNAYIDAPYLNIVHRTIWMPFDDSIQSTCRIIFTFNSFNSIIGRQHNAVLFACPLFMLSEDSFLSSFTHTAHIFQLLHRHINCRLICMGCRVVLFWTLSTILFDCYCCCCFFRIECVLLSGWIDSKQR